jgi:CheY-like chemotaxis protein
MKPLSVVVAQSNSKTAEMLAKSLYNHFRVVHLAGDVDELRQAIPRYRADVAIVDLELAALMEVQQLKRILQPPPLSVHIVWRTKRCGPMRWRPAPAIVVTPLMYGPSFWRPAIPSSWLTRTQPEKDLCTLLRSKQKGAL